MILLLVLACTSPSMIKASATQNAETFSKEMNIPLSGVTCSDFDGDHDGYVTCTLNMGDGKMKAIECTYTSADDFYTRTGCKEKAVMTIQGSP